LATGRRSSTGTSAPAVTNSGWPACGPTAGWLGHQDANVISRIYSHLLLDAGKQGREALDAA